MFKELILVKIKGMEIPIEVKRYKKSNSIKLMSSGTKIRVTTNLYISRTKIKEILKPYNEKIYMLYAQGLKDELKEEDKKEKLELHTYIEGLAQEIIFESYSGPKVSPVYINNQIIISMKEEMTYDNVFKQLDSFYLSLAKEYLPKYFESHLPSFVGATKAELRIKKMVRQWGNCKKSAPIITLNSQLIKLPSELINYVIFHELAHLVQPNHSKDFYNIIEHRYPYRKELDRRLKKWGFILKDNYIEEYSGEKSS